MLLISFIRFVDFSVQGVVFTDKFILQYFILFHANLDETVFKLFFRFFIASAQNCIRFSCVDVILFSADSSICCFIMPFLSFGMEF